MYFSARASPRQGIAAMGGEKSESLPAWGYCVLPARLLSRVRSANGFVGDIAAISGAGDFPLTATVSHGNCTRFLCLFPEPYLIFYYRFPFNARKKAYVRQKNGQMLFLI